jgi:predicted nucleic-acid-binding Zn-ribbon protein
MSTSTKCPKCGRGMKEGFILDATYGGKLVSKWVAGKPEASFWSGTKVGDREQHSIQSFRCVACGFLESYANES